MAVEECCDSAVNDGGVCVTSGGSSYFHIDRVALYSEGKLSTVSYHAL